MNSLISFCRGLASRVFAAALALLIISTKAHGADAAVADPPSAAVTFYTISPGRIGSIVGGVLGLIGVVSGWRALARRGGSENGLGQRGAIVALAAGVLGMALGGWVVATAKGGLGTGNGLGGGIVALLVGSIAIVLGGLALSRARSRD